MSTDNPADYPSRLTDSERKAAQKAAKKADKKAAKDSANRKRQMGARGRR